MCVYVLYHCRLKSEALCLESWPHSGRLMQTGEVFVGPEGDGDDI